MKINPEYYSLDEAAKYLDSSANDLLHLGAQGKINIYVETTLSMKLIPKGVSNHNTTQNILNPITSPVRTPPYLKVAKVCLEEKIAGYTDVIVIDGYDTLNLKRYDFSKKYNIDVKFDNVKLVIKQDEIISKSNTIELKPNILIQNNNHYGDTVNGDQIKIKDTNIEGSNIGNGNQIGSASPPAENLFKKPVFYIGLIVFLYAITSLILAYDLQKHGQLGNKTYKDIATLPFSFIKDISDEK
jgi:hypothetical protein